MSTVTPFTYSATSFVRGVPIQSRWESVACPVEINSSPFSTSQGTGVIPFLFINCLYINVYVTDIFCEINGSAYTENTHSLTLHLTGIMFLPCRASCESIHAARFQLLRLKIYMLCDHFYWDGTCMYGLRGYCVNVG